MGAVLYWEIPW